MRESLRRRSFRGVGRFKPRAEGARSRKGAAGARVA